jgi:hypothetical protein
MILAALMVYRGGRMTRAGKLLVLIRSGEGLYANKDSSASHKVEATLILHLVTPSPQPSTLDA